MLFNNQEIPKIQNISKIQKTVGWQDEKVNETQVKHVKVNQHRSHSQHPYTQQELRDLIIQFPLKLVER